MPHLHLNKIQVNKYQRDGYLIIDTELPTSVLDQVTTDLEDIWNGEKTESLPVVQKNRIQSAWKISQSAKTIADNQRILEILQQLYHKKALPFQTLNFRYGTEQPIHSDSLHFNSEPFGMMCGVWVALEDIGIDQGPLIFYPGSNQLPEMNFHDMSLAPGDFKSYRTYIQNLITEKKLKPNYGTMKKGQALIWTANLLHGGAKQNNKALSRLSQVTHYFFEDSKYWRPTLSKEERHYFTPEWVKHSPAAAVQSLKNKWRIKKLVSYIKK